MSNSTPDIAGPLSISLILPAYNEASRLPATLDALACHLSTHPNLDCEVVVVDNDSSDGTGAIVRAAMADQPWLRLVHIGQRGKGYAVRAGMASATRPITVFADADLSWPLDALEQFGLLAQHVPVVIGSREGHGAQRVAEPVHRHLMGRVFNMLVQCLLVPGVGDTQCGFKAFQADAARAIFGRQSIGGFGFDVEILYLARRLGYDMLVQPLRWEHRASSRVQPVRDSLRMLMDIMWVRLRALRGYYAEPTPISGVLPANLNP